MKKLRLFLISLFILVASLPLLLRAEAFAEQSSENEVQTGIFLPTSYLQYYRLDNPYAICRYQDEDENFVAISHKDAIVIYKNEKFYSVELDLGDISVKAIQRYKNFLIYLYKSKIHYVDITGFENAGWEANSVNTGIVCSNSFSICGDNIVINTSDTIEKYSIVTDLSGGFAIDESSIEERTFQNSAMLLLSPNGNVYTSILGQNGIYSWNDSINPVIENASNVESIICSQDGATVYYSCPDGIYEVDVSKANSEQISVISASEVTEDADLGKIYKPKGICLVSDKLWVVDWAINAVQEIDLSNGNEFTEFAITTNSSAINRLTENAKDIVVDKDKIYALDNGRIVVINDIDTENRTYNRINLTGGNIQEFSVGNGYVCYYSGGYVHLSKISKDEDDELIFNLTEKASTELAGVVDITYSENAFYLITTETINNESHPVVYKISLDVEPHQYVKILSNQTETGSAMEVVADVFGTIYYCTKNVSNYEFFSFDGNEIKHISSRPIESALLNLQTDFDGKLFALYENNVIDIISEDEIVTKALKTSDNLNEINPAKSMCLSCNSQTAYFIFEGLILNSSVVTDLNIATPHNIEIPASFSTDFNFEQEFANVKAGAKLFEIDLNFLNGEYFKFIDYNQSLDSQTDYAVIPLSEKYSLLIKDGVSAVARNSDIIERRNISSESIKKYAIVSFNVYSIPVLENHFVSASGFDKYDLVEITGAITFNEINYYVVKNGDDFGYIPDTFFTDSIISEDGSKNVHNVYVFKKGGIKVYDKEGNVIGVIEKKTKVTVLETGAKLIILYGNGIGYINSDCIVSSSRNEIMKSIAIILCALSVCVTALYFEKRFLIKKH